MKCLKKFLTFLIILLVILVGIAGYYVSDYYHALDFDKAQYKETRDVNVKKYDGFTVYGSEEAEYGLIFYPGGKVEEKSYEPLILEIASQGICCVIVDMPLRLAVFGMDRAELVLNQIIGVDHWYLGGHSLGGAMASWYVAEHTDDFLGLILVAAYPIQELPQNFPVLSIFGSEDQVLNKEKYTEKISNAGDLTERVINGGIHSYFGNYGEQSGDGDAMISPKEQWEITKEEVLNFIHENDTKLIL